MSGGEEETCVFHDSITDFLGHHQNFFSSHQDSKSPPVNLLQLTGA